MYFYLLSLLRSEIVDQCEAFTDKELSITLFTRDKCGPCDRIKPFVEEIDSRLERNGKNIKIRMVNCSQCNCQTENIKVVPELIVNNDNVEVNRLTGFKEFGEIIDFLIKNTGIERKIFAKRIKSNPGSVVKLKENDFYTGFDGPWLVLFYNSKSDIKRDIIKEIADEYTSKLNIGEINGNIEPALLQRFNLTKLPALLALYNGLMMGYNGEDSLDEIREFVDELIRPSFENIDIEQFKKLNDDVLSKYPIFIVFYKELGLANEYFKTVAHEYKFKTRIYKSSDLDLIKHAQIKLENKDLTLVAYKNGLFHECPYDVVEKEKIFEWIWHSHYPYVTQINNNNFYGIMHGLKPAVILLTKNELMLSEFEQTSESMHKGMPFTDQLFAAIDVDAYSLFIPSLLPGISIPYIVILDPTNDKFYTHKMKLTSLNLQENIEIMIEKYNNGKLSIYPYKHGWFKIFFLILGIFGFFYICKKQFNREKYIISEKK
ncbi:hypothetical protein COBT_000217 [Conglomerata obtusa]